MDTAYSSIHPNDLIVILVLRTIKLTQSNAFWEAVTTHNFPLVTVEIKGGAFYERNIVL
jgi:hypothetical protein